MKTYDFDDDLIRKVKTTQHPQYKIYRPENVLIVLGRGSDPEIELNLDACKRDDIPIYQRAGGGCSVVLDAGNVIVSVVLPVGGFLNSSKYFDKLSQWLIGKLDDLGFVGIYQDGVSDLVLDGMKIGGSSMKRTKEYLYYSTTLLIEPDITLMERYLKYPPREPEYRKGRSHSDFVGKLQLNYSGDRVEQLIENLNKSISTMELTYLI